MVFPNEVMDFRLSDFRQFRHPLTAVRITQKANPRRWLLIDKSLWGLRVQAPFGAVGIGTGTWAVLSSIPEG